MFARGFWNSRQSCWVLRWWASYSCWCLQTIPTWLTHVWKASRIIEAPGPVVCRGSYIWSAWARTWERVVGASGIIRFCGIRSPLDWGTNRSLASSIMDHSVENCPRGRSAWLASRRGFCCRAMREDFKAKQSETRSHVWFRFLVAFYFSLAYALICCLSRLE